jgi:ATP-binding cassette, subfamily B, bacterial
LKSYIETEIEGQTQAASRFAHFQRTHPLIRCLTLYAYMPWQFSITALLFILVNAGMAWQLWLVGQVIQSIHIGEFITRNAQGILDFSNARYWLTLLISVAIGRAVLQYIGGVMSLIIGQELLYILRERILYQVQRLDLAYHWQHGIGEIVTRTTRDADKVRDALINFWRQVFEASIWVVISVTVLSIYHPLIGIGTLLLVVAGMLLFIRHTNALVLLDREVGNAYDQVNQELSEGVNGIRVIKAFGLETQRTAHFTSLVDTFVTHARTALAYAAKRIPLPQIVIGFSQVWILALGAYLVSKGVLNVGQLVSALLIANALVFRVEGIGRVMQVFADARASAARIWELLDEQPKILSGKTEIQPQALGFRLLDITTNAPNSDKAILQHCSLEVSPGETIAIVGATGAGKSSLAGLLPRLLDAAQGSVEVGSAWAGWHDVKTLDLHQLRKLVHVVPQESFLFSDTLAANLRLAKPDATDEELLQALHLAAADEVLEKLSDGLHTKIGDRGITLSGGQRQRISLARAFLSQPSILVLDDSTSALDAITERTVLDNIRHLREHTGKNITVLIIASKLSTILLADRVAMLAEGKIIAEGTHESLINADSSSGASWAYRDLVGVQHG